MTCTATSHFHLDTNTLLWLWGIALSEEQILSGSYE